MQKPTLKIGFAGTPDFAASHLDALLAAGMQVVAVYTQPDRPAGRGKQAQPSPVKTLALAHELPVYQPASLKTEQAQADMAHLDLDLLVVVAYGLLLPQEILRLPRFGCINVHASLLPRWRGAAPIEWAILAGDTATGITIMQMDAGLDTGDMLLSLSTPITEEDNSASLSARLLELGPRGLLKVIGQIEEQCLQPQPQDDTQSTYARKLTKEDSLVDWHKSAHLILRQLHALFPRAPAYSYYQGERIRFIEGRVLNEDPAKNPGSIIQVDKQGIKVACAEGCLLVTNIQLPSKAAMNLATFLNGRQDFFKAGTRFSDTPDHANGQ